MTQPVKFTCPECGDHRVEEIMVDVTVSSEITAFDELGDFEYRQPMNDGGVSHYQCLYCGQVIQHMGENITDPRHLYNYLAKQNQ